MQRQQLGFCELDIEIYESVKFKITNHKINKKTFKFILIQYGKFLSLIGFTI